MKLLHNRYEYKNGVKYDPATFKRPRIVRAVDDIIRDLMEFGYAIIPAREQLVIKGRLRKADVRASFYKLDNGRVKVTPRQE